MDLDAYLARIGWSGPAPATAVTLGRLAAHHTQAIAFENLTPFLGQPVALDIPALERKLVRQRRGGYCFEQNALFAAALAELGYDVSGLGARVLWGAAEDAMGPRSHMVLRVELEGESWIVDVGFGGVTLTGALRLVPDIEQPTTLEPFRLIRVDGDWRLQVLIAGAWRSLYRFDLQRQYPADYAVSNYYTATHSTSPFVGGLMLARPIADRRYALLNRDFAIHRIGAPSERRRLGGPDEIIAVLEDHFDLAARDLPGLPERLARLP